MGESLPSSVRDHTYRLLTSKMVTVKKSSSLSALLLARVPLVLVSSEDKLTEMESLSLEHFPLTPMLMIIITDIMKIIMKELHHKLYLVVANVKEEMTQMSALEL